MSLEQRPSSDAEQTPRAVTAALTIGGFVAVLWAVEVLDTLLDHRLDREGIEPRETDGLLGIVFAPLLHAGWGHLLSNTLPALVLGFLILLSGVRAWAAATAVVWVVAGVGTWLTGADNSVHLGASSLVFGWLTYLIVRGVFSRRPAQILLGVVILLTYGGLLWGVLPGQEGISWQGHLFGALGGVLAAWLLVDRAGEPVRRT